MAGVSTLVPSLALMPTTSFCERRISGGGGNTPDRFGPVRTVAVNAGGVAIVVEQRALGGVVRIGRGGERMPDLGRGVLGKDVGVGAMGETLEPPLWQAMQSCSFWPRSRRDVPAALCGVWQRDAGVGSDRSVASDQRLGRDLVGGQCVRAGGPIGQRIDLAAHLPGRDRGRPGTAGRLNCP